MSLRLLAALQGDLKRIMADELKTAEQAVTSGVRQATDGLKGELRNQISSAGLGQKLANTWRGQVYPKGGASLNAAGFVWSKAPEIVSAFGNGVTIRSSHGFFLAIPTEAAGKSAMGKRITPGLWEQAHGMRLRFVYRRGAVSLLVADNMRARTGKRGGFSAASTSALRTGRGLTTVPIFLLVPQVTLRKRFDIDRAANKWTAHLPSLVIQNWEGGSSQS
ncbi:MAG: DUF6441 family protein [Bdellovibrionales bacterium]